MSQTETDILYAVLFGGVALLGQYLPAKFGIPMGLVVVGFSVWKLGWVGWPLALSIVLFVLVIARIVIVLHRKSSEQKQSKGISALKKDDKDYIAKLNKELQGINDYYEKLVNTVDVNKISNKKIKEIENLIIAYLKLKTVKFSKPPKTSEAFKALYFIFYDIFKICYVLIKGRIKPNYGLELFLNIGTIPDTAGIGLSSYDSKGKQLLYKMKQVVGERISSNHTIDIIWRCKDACYSVSNIYLWILMYPKAHKNSRANFKEILSRLYKFREKMMAYAFADVNKAVIEEFLGNGR